MTRGETLCYHIFMGLGRFAGKIYLICNISAHRLSLKIHIRKDLNTDSPNCKRLIREHSLYLTLLFVRYDCRLDLLVDRSHRLSDSAGYKRGYESAATSCHNLVCIRSAYKEIALSDRQKIIFILKHYHGSA